MSIIRLGGLSRRLGGRAVSLAALGRGKGKGGTPTLGLNTTFPNSQNPLQAPLSYGSQQAGLGAAGPLIVGGSPGYCCASAADRTDQIGVYSGIVSNRHFSEVTIRRVGGYTPPGTHEIEIHVGMFLDGSHATSYEFDIWFGGSQLQPIKWIDPLGSFDTGAITTLSSTWPGAIADGDVVRVEFDSTSGSPVMTVKLNGTTVGAYTDTGSGKILSGSPGFAFFADTGATPASWCIKGFSCGTL